MPGPMIMSFILAPLIENALRQSLLLSAGSFSIFVSRPISGTLMAVFALLVIGQIVVAVRNKNKKRPTATDCTLEE